ncbi:DUF4184 family protein [Maribacter sp. 2-571]|uniref:DUF4184 family protein n=1 Tax=Maribacter sp. 2-571 TaxID=3417569 RepID=UPI003D3526AE
MPFTASHPALILPLLKKRWVSASGLIMGSMVPDFEFFLRMEAHGPYGHGFWGMFWLNIPLALGFICLYHLMVRNALIRNLPSYFERRFRIFTKFDWLSYFKAHFWTVVLSVLIGNLAHLLWDAFTHFDGFFVIHWPVLERNAWGLPLYDILQYAFSLVGALCILKYIASLPTGRPVAKVKNNLWYWSLLTIVCALVMTVRFWGVPGFDFDDQIVCLLLSFMVGLLVASLIDPYLKNRIRRPLRE